MHVHPEAAECSPGLPVSFPAGCCLKTLLKSPGIKSGLHQRCQSRAASPPGTVSFQKGETQAEEKTLPLGWDSADGAPSP